MKRREFLVSSAGLAGALLPAASRGTVRPCPPPTTSISGGSAAKTSCTVDPQSDWLLRSTGPGVKWAQNFATQAEFDNFVVYASPGTPDPRQIFRDTTDGITGACLNMTVLAGSKNNHRWIRPFSALPGDIGYKAGDPAYVGGQNWYRWRNGLYGHPDYWSQGNFAGHDFYIQFRHKVTSSMIDPSNPNTIKLAYVELAGGSSQELLIQQPINGNLYYWMYTNFGSHNNSYLGANQQAGSGNSGGSMQPGGAYDATCYYAHYGVNNCWTWPLDTWVTVLIHVIPGRQGAFSGSPGNNSNVDYTQPNPNSGQSTNNTGIQVWVAGPTDTSYTKIWDKQDYVWCYDAVQGNTYGNPFGFNVFETSQYVTGGYVSPVSWTRKFDQIIFSTQFIPCPQA